MAGLKINGQMSVNQSNAIPKIENPYNFTEKDKNTLTMVLSDCTHIEKLYVCKNGHISHIRFQYTGGVASYKDKEGKYYARMNKTKKRGIDPHTRLDTNIRVDIPYDEFEIVNSFRNENYIEVPAKEQDYRWHGYFNIMGGPSYHNPS